MSAAQQVAVDNTPVVKGFMRVNTKEARIKQDELELEQLKADNVKTEEEKANEQEPESAEERSFKKRYGDLRRHQQTQKVEFEDQITALKAELTTAAKGAIELPSSEGELEAWVDKHPQVANIMRTMAIKESQSQNESLEARLKEIDEMHLSASQEKAEARLLQLHPDFDAIRDDDAFHDWVDEQPKWVQDALYSNETDAKSAARAIDLYKLDAGITKQKKGKKDNGRSAASDVGTRGGSTPGDASSEGRILESDVANMDIHTYEANQDDIAKAIRSGNFVYDLSGSAR
jgi:hypothetical protein